MIYPAPIEEASTQNIMKVTKAIYEIKNYEYKMNFV